MRRRHILFNSSTHPSTECPGSSSSVDPSARTCPVCACTLSSEEGMAEAHVDACLGGGGAGPGSVGGDSSDSEEYEEYTWCNVTRVRATSMLSPQARASESTSHITTASTESDAIGLGSHLSFIMPSHMQCLILQTCLMGPSSPRERAVRPMRWWMWRKMRQLCTDPLSILTHT